MEKLNISENQKEQLCFLLAKIALEFKKDENVECIYYAAYNGFRKISGDVLEITIVRKDTKEESISESIKKYNNLYNQDSLNKFGLRICVDIDYEDKYTIIDLNSSEVRRSNNLFNSTILFDRTGKYKEIQEQTKKYGINVEGGIFYYDNLIEIVPPLIDSDIKYQKSKKRK